MTSRSRAFAALAVLSLLLTACAGETTDTTGVSAPVPTTAQPPVTQPAQTTVVPTTMPAPSTTTTLAGDEELPDEIEETDWLTAANGLVIISREGDVPAIHASTAIRAIDGAPNEIGFSFDTAVPTVYVFELPAETTFDRFAVPGVGDRPGNATFFANIEIAGSNTSATEGFEVLVSEEFEILEDDEEFAEFEPANQNPVRWIRLTLSGALFLDPAHPAGKTTVGFTELIGNGTQELVPLSDAFTGVWSLRYDDNPDGSGTLTELKQNGATVSGCIGFAEVTGTVTGNVLRLNGIDTRDQRPSVYLLVPAGDGELRGVESTRNSVFRARFTVAEPEGTETPCSDQEPEPLACDSIVYVNFDVNSANIRPDSEQVLQDLFDGLTSSSVTSFTIEGHTSTEGSDEYNQDLSERRAQAVVDNLIAKGMAADQLAAVGKGETEPLVSETDESSRSINRRVEIDCG